MLRLAILLVLISCLGGCADRQHRNPLDPLTTFVDDSIEALVVLAGDGEVVLRWDYSHFTDISGYQIYRRTVGEGFAENLIEALDREVREFVDAEVENGTTYEYRLALLIEDEGERFVDLTHRATPGPETAWAVDRTSGFVWKLSPDGRTSRLSIGRFPSVNGAALDRRSGALWVSDRFLEGLQVVDSEGELLEVQADIGESGVLSIDADNGLGWVGDNESREVSFFPLESVLDTLELTVVDAHFVEISALAARERQCWIADGESGRVLLYDIERKQVVEFVDLEGFAALAAGLDGRGWILVDEGAVLLRLDRDGGMLRLDLPAFSGRELAIDRRTGVCWVVGGSEVAAFDAQGTLLIQWTGIERGRAVAVDEVQQRVWIAGGDALWKFTMAGEQLVRLGGFANLQGVEINPGM